MTYFQVTNGMEGNMRIFYCATAMILGAAAMMAMTLPAGAQALSNNMTCAQAQATYEKQGRLQTRTRRGDVITLRGGVPKSRSAGLVCGRSGRMATHARTKDKKRCPIFYRCS